MFRGTVLWMVAGCGRLAFEPTGAELDAAIDAAGTGLAQQRYVKASNTGAADEFGRSLALSGDGQTLVVGAKGEASATIGIDGDQTDDSAPGAGAVYVYGSSGAYVKASNTDAGDEFGNSVALSADGLTLAVGAYLEDSAATGINGNQALNTAPDGGAVYVFTRAGDAWTQQAYVKASNTDAGDQFGIRVALSADGSTLAVGAVLEDSSAPGVGGNQADNLAIESGAVYVFTRAGTSWTQQAYIKASDPMDQDHFGFTVTLSADGSTLAVGSRREDSAATGIDGNQADISAPGSGAVYVFTRAGTTWTQQAYMKASNTGPDDNFGFATSLSADGSTLVVSANIEDSAATGIDGDQVDDSAMDSGAVYVFTRTGTSWAQQSYLKASNTGAGDRFGYSLALSADGSTIVIGSAVEGSAATGIDGNQADDSAPASGAVYLFARSGTSWSQQAYIKASNTGAQDEFGFSVGISADGSSFAVAASLEDSAATGIDGDQADNTAPDAGAVYVFQ